MQLLGGRGTWPACCIAACEAGALGFAVMSSVAPTLQAVKPRVARVKAYVALTKPRIIELLLVTTVPAMFVAARGLPSAVLVAETLVGGTLAAGGANAVNMVVDRDIDRIMQRTQGRPLVTGELAPAQALTFALALEAAAFVELALLVNLLSALLAISAMLFYVFIYTIWLKRTSRQNIVIGGAAGAVPTLVGWSAVTGHLGLAPWLLFAVVFVWTPPHFWALAIRYRDDYRSAGVPMLPAVASVRSTSLQILAYTLALLGVTLFFGAVAGMGFIYMGAASGLGILFVAMALRLVTEPTPKVAMRLFGYSITYLTVLFVAMALDVVVRHP
jgi:protoheme IX farnesyltransferase